MDQPHNEEIGRAYIIKKGKFSVVPLYDYSELKIVDEVLNQNKNKENHNLNKFLQPTKRSVSILWVNWKNP